MVESNVVDIAGRDELADPRLKRPATCVRQANVMEKARIAANIDPMMHTHTELKARLTVGRT